MNRKRRKPPVPPVDSAFFLHPTEGRIEGSVNVLRVSCPWRVDRDWVFSLDGCSHPSVSEKRLSNTCLKPINVLSCPGIELAESEKPGSLEEVAKGGPQKMEYVVSTLSELLALTRELWRAEQSLSEEDAPTHYQYLLCKCGRDIEMQARDDGTGVIIYNGTCTDCEAKVCLVFSEKQEDFHG